VLCCRCKNELDTNMPPAIDFASGQLVCPDCHQQEKCWLGSQDFGDVVMSQVDNAEVWE
jgi:hypothetical protein